MLSPREKSPIPEKFSEEDGTHDAASSKTASPTHYQRALPAPALKHLVSVTAAFIRSKKKKKKKKKEDTKSIHHSFESNLALYSTFSQVSDLPPPSPSLRPIPLPCPISSLAHSLYDLVFFLFFFFFFLPSLYNNTGRPFKSSLLSRGFQKHWRVLQDEKEPRVRLVWVVFSKFSVVWQVAQSEM